MNFPILKILILNITWIPLQINHTKDHYHMQNFLTKLNSYFVVLNLLN